MRIAFYGDSLTEGSPGISFIRVLEAMLPEHELLNLGKGGDTVVSLYRRIARHGTHDPVDLAVLWVGVNDVLATVSLSHSTLKWLMRQPRARDLAEFRQYYHRTLKRLRRSADSILTVSPLVIGEDPSNRWNRRLADLSRIASTASAAFDHVHFLNLRAELTAIWRGRKPSDYIPRSVTRIAWESLFLRSPAGVDRAASRRGLRLTLDGVHLNSKGAELVAEALREAIETLC